MVEVKFNSHRIIPHYYNIYLHFTCIHSLFMPWFSTHLTLTFIKTPNSWLFHITRICTSKCIVKNSRNKVTIHFIILWYNKKFTQWYEHRIHSKSLCLSVLLKPWIQITTKFHVLLKSKQQGKFVVFYYKILIGPPTLPQKLCVFKSSLLPKTFPFWAIPSHITMVQKQQKFEIQTNNVPWLVPIQMPCSSKPCTHPTPLTSYWCYYAIINWSKYFINYVHLILTM